MSKLTDKQMIFANEYLVDLNATRAYKKAYPKVKKDSVAAVNGNRLLRNAKVEEYIEKRMKDRAKRTEVTQDMIIEELSKVAFSNGTDFAKVVRKSYKKPKLDAKGNIIDEEEVFYDDVEIVSTDDLSADKRKAIVSIKQTKFGVVVESADKLKALELLGRHLGMFKDKLEIEGSINTNPYEGLTTEQLLKLAEV